jgi:hypothetical protein
MFFQLADARRHIGLNAIEFVGCTDDPALVNDGSKDLQRFQVDRSHPENHTAELFICANRSAAPSSAACEQISTSAHAAPRFRSRPPASDLGRVLPAIALAETGKESNPMSCIP